MEYSQRFKDAYELHGAGTGMDIDTWCEDVGKHLSEFQSKRQIFNPVSLSVKLTPDFNDPQGSVKIQIPVTDHDWFHTLTDVISGMVNQDNIDVVDCTGESIKGFSAEQILESSGFDVVDNDSRRFIRIDNVVAPPRKMCNNKPQYILQWWETIRDDISTEVISELCKKKNMATIAPAVSLKGPLHARIESMLSGSNPFGESWNTFLQTYAVDDVTRGLDTKQVTKRIADIIISRLRTGLFSNQRHIGAYFSQIEDDEDQLWDDGQKSKSIYTDKTEMFKDIFEDVIFQGSLERDICDTIYHGYNVVQHNQKKVKFSPPRKINKQHPMDEYYHTHHYKEFGKMPGHVVNKFNKNFKKDNEHVNTQYPGIPEKAMDAFYKYIGKISKPQKRPYLKPFVENEMPELVSNHDSYDNEMPELVSRKPRLIPINDSYDNECCDGFVDNYPTF